jgi:hypothetical protein
VENREAIATNRETVGTRSYLKTEELEPIHPLSREGARLKSI